MTDILKIALDRRAELHDEAARIDDFIRMADVLLRKVQPYPDRAAGGTPGFVREPSMSDEAPGAFAEQAGGAPREVVPGVTRMNLMRRSPAAVNG